MYKKIILIITLFSAVIIAQDDYQKWLQQEKEKYNQYLEEQDKDFIEFLKNDWDQFKLFSGEKSDQAPKPVEQPIVKIPPKEISPISPEPIMPIDIDPTVDKEEVVEDSPIPSEPELDKIEIDETVNTENVEIDFYGNINEVFYPKEIIVNVETPITNNTIAEFYSNIASKPYKDLLKQLLDQKERMRLNDWQYITLLKRSAEKLYPNSRNDIYLFTWFLMLKSGYKARTGTIGNYVYIFAPSEQTIFDFAYFQTGDEELKYYILDLGDDQTGEEGDIYTYKKDYPGADKIIDMNIKDAPIILEEVTQKQISFNVGDTSCAINIEYYPSTIKLYENYPYTQLSIYFDSDVTTITKNSLLNGLSPFITGRSNEEAVNILLKFVQFSFEYEIDQPNFGREKPLFVEETLFYPSSDCEDRAVLFSFLVKNLLGLKVIGVDYPGHVATAVKIDSDMKGDSVTFRGEKYLVCDPTYLGATIGMAQDEFKSGNYERLIEIN